MRLRRIPALASSALMGLAALLLFGQGFAAWGIALGFDGGGGLGALPPSSRNLAVALAVISPVAGIGAWFRAQWGPVLWGIAVVALIVGITLDVPHPALRPLLAVHGVLLALWLVAIALAERRAPAPVMED